MPAEQYVPARYISVPGIRCTAVFNCSKSVLSVLRKIIFENNYNFYLFLMIFLTLVFNYLINYAFPILFCQRYSNSCKKMKIFFFVGYCLPIPLCSDTYLICFFVAICLKPFLVNQLCQPDAFLVIFELSFVLNAFVFTSISMGR